MRVTDFLPFGLIGVSRGKVPKPRKCAVICCWVTLPYLGVLYSANPFDAFDCVSFGFYLAREGVAIFCAYWLSLEAAI